MKKVFVLFGLPMVFVQSCFSSNENTGEVARNDTIKSQSAADTADVERIESSESTVDEFLPLTDNIKREISGAFVGLGFTMSKVTNKVSLTSTERKADAAHHIEAQPAANHTLKENNTQPSVSIIGGFGGNFYKRYYAGLDLELVRRLSSKEKGRTDVGNNGLNDVNLNIGGQNNVPVHLNRNCEAAVVFDSYTGLNADVRLGYQLQNGVLPYFTFGFSKENGKVTLYDRDTKAQLEKASYGSFHPTLGFGLEYRLNYCWNIRGDFRISIPSTDTGKRYHGYSQRAKTSKVSFRVAITRNI